MITKPSYVEQPGIRQIKVKKAVPFTIEPIGGIEDLKKWKLERSKPDLAAIERADKRREKAIAILIGPPLPTYGIVIGERPKISRFQKIKNAITKWCKTLWNNAFDPEYKQ